MSKIIDFDRMYANYIDHWGTISNENVDKCKDYIRNLCDIEFTQLVVVTITKNARVVGFNNDGTDNKDVYMLLDLGSCRCKFINGDFNCVRKNLGSVSFTSGRDDICVNLPPCAHGEDNY